MLIWKILGWVFFAAGLVGLLLPVVPTVPFLILAAFCFERGSPELHRWLLAHPTFGPSLRQWRDHRVIAPRHKALAVSCILVSVGYVLFFRSVPVEAKIAMGLICLAVILFILTRKNRA